MVSLGNFSLDTGWVADNQQNLLIGGAAGLAALGLLYKRSSRDYKKSPSSFQLSGGAVDAGEVKNTVRLAAMVRASPFKCRRGPATAHAALATGGGWAAGVGLAPFCLLNWPHPRPLSLRSRSTMASTIRWSGARVR